MAHQLLGNASCLPGSPVLLERSEQSICTAADGQHHCSGVYQQPGGTVSPQLTSLAKSLWL